MADSETLSKSEFAARCGVTPGRVSQWISEGKIAGAALSGEGRFARIVVAEAERQLKVSLDANQRFGLNGIATRLSGGASQATSAVAPEPDIGNPISEAVPAPVSSVPPASDSDPIRIDPVEEQIRREKLQQAQFTTRRLAREDRETAGVYMRADDARAEMSRIAASMMTMFEGAFVDLATALAAQFSIPNRDVLYCLRQEFRSVRERVAGSLQQQVVAVPETIDDPEMPGEPE